MELKITYLKDISDSNKLASLLCIPIELTYAHIELTVYINKETEDIDKSIITGLMLIGYPSEKDPNYWFSSWITHKEEQLNKVWKILTPADYVSLDTLSYNALEKKQKEFKDDYDPY